MSDVTVPVKRHRISAKMVLLEDFAEMIETRLKQGYGPDAVANFICRLLTHKDPKIAGPIWCKWVEWRYGKAKEHLEHSGPDGGPVHIQILSHVPRPGDRRGDDPDARDGVVLGTDKPN